MLVYGDVVTSNLDIAKSVQVLGMWHFVEQHFQRVLILYQSTRVGSVV